MSRVARITAVQVPQIAPPSVPDPQFAGVARIPAIGVPQIAPPERGRAIAALAANQYGVVSAAQLVALGLSDRAIRARQAAGTLHRIHRGVYAVGHPLLPREGIWMAAVLACGDGALLSHRSAGALWGMRAAGGSSIDVAVPTRAGRRRPGIAIHSPRSPAPGTAHRGIPCTTPERTLVDLADILKTRELERAIEQAQILRLVDFARITPIPGRRGFGGLTAALATANPAPDTTTRSELEVRFRGLCRDLGLPQPIPNLHIALTTGDAFEVDFAWPAHRLIVETDGFAFHNTRAAFERDRERDRVLLSHGWRVVRVTARQLADEPERIAAQLRALLNG